LKQASKKNTDFNLLIFFVILLVMATIMQIK